MSQLELLFGHAIGTAQGSAVDRDPVRSADLENDCGPRKRDREITNLRPLRTPPPRTNDLNDFTGGVRRSNPPHPPVAEGNADLGGEIGRRSAVEGTAVSAEPSFGAGATADPPRRTPTTNEESGRPGELGPGESPRAKNCGPTTTFTAPTDLRPYQLEAFLGIRRAWVEGARSALVVMPTGTGKTRVIGAIARTEHELGGRTLVIAHREELLEQLAGELARAGVIRDAGAIGVLEKAEQRGSLSSPAVVASIQSLTAKRLARYPVDHFTKIVVDEAHHSTATGYQRVLEYFAAAKILGVTATPDRADGKPLGDAFDRVAYTYEIRTAIAEGYLVRPAVRRITVQGLDLSSVKSHHGDFDRGQLGAILAAEQMLHGVAKPLVDEAGDRKTIVFAVDVAHAHALAEVINRYRPGLAMALDGSCSLEQRRAVLALFRRGEIQYLVNCQLLTEGFDEQSIACVAMARPTQSRGFYVQCLGRGFRVLGANYAESCANGKVDCLVLDFVGASKHPLRGPVDALAGSLDPAVREQVEKILAAGETDVEKALELAEERAAAAANKAQVLALVEYRKRDIDPFLGDQMRPVEKTPWANDPATEAQLQALKAIGLGKPPIGITKGEASAIIEANGRARDKRLATIAQQRVLQNVLRLDTHGMLQSRATELVVEAKEKGWQPFLFSDEPEAQTPYARMLRSRRS